MVCARHVCRRYCRQTGKGPKTCDGQPPGLGALGFVFGHVPPRTRGRWSCCTCRETRALRLGKKQEKEETLLQEVEGGRGKKEDNGVVIGRPRVSTLFRYRSTGREFLSRVAIAPKLSHIQQSFNWEENFRINWTRSSFSTITHF